ncbi:sugar ABC transporter substrate-binding protein [Falsibacillus pallidus]|uniref:sugar ABC transporter substrate-binding protein n=1 Tax=Falsibacillus pallidus TaxID=493781 RepID=UPI003D988683
MRKIGIILLCFVCVFIFYLTAVSAEKVFHSDWQLPGDSGQKEAKYRLVLITQELETPFWDKVGKGAIEQAKKEGASLEVWGSYGHDQEDFLKKVEIAIQSKVDGIIVQGLDTEKFKTLAKVKAAFYGIPIITIANDVPMEESLRRTYVGSDQYQAGTMIARQLLSDMGLSGTVVLFGNTREEYFQQQRLKGMQDVLKNYPKVHTIYAETNESKEEIIASTQDLLNNHPEVNAFIAVNANITGAMVQEIGRRYKVEPYFIYTFDDGADSLSLLKQGKLDGMIEQSPDMMGKKSVSEMMQWLRGEKVPLDMKGYHTDIRIVKAKDVQ